MSNKYCPIHKLLYDTMVQRDTRCPKCKKEDKQRERQAEEDSARKAKEKEKLNTKWRQFQALRFGPDETAKPRLANPSLDLAMAFISEFRASKRDYQCTDLICLHFSREIVSSATAKGLRCGYATLAFPNNMSCPVAAFHIEGRTVYFEPNDLHMVEIQIGLPYHCRVHGVPTICLVETITVDWNDGTRDGLPT